MDELSGVRPKLKWDRKKILAFHKEDSNYSDSFLDDILEEEWNVLCDEVTKMMGPVTEWECEVLNFGYRGLEGRQTFDARTGRQLLRKVLPDTECIFHVYTFRNESITIRNWHKASPRGKEIYKIRPKQYKETIPSGPPQA
jgi:hypothetical protein